MEKPLCFQKNHKFNKNAFTLIELLIVLWLVSILVILITPPLIAQKQSFDVTQFFKVFKSDILLIQQKALQGETYKITFQNDQYMVTQSTKIINKRPYPKDLQLRGYNEKTISFSINGNITKPTTYYFKHHDDDIVLVFPLGRGGFYFKE